MITTQSMHHRANDALAIAASKRKELQTYLSFAGRSQLATGIQEQINEIDCQVIQVKNLAASCALTFGRSRREEQQVADLRKAVNRLTRLAK